MRQESTVRFHSIALGILAAVMLLTNTVLSRPQAQTPAGPPNNSTPGTATANSGRPAIFKVDRHQITLRPKEGIEYKYEMEKGATMLYSWKVTGGKVNHEFHGEPEGAPRGYADVFERGRGRAVARRILSAFEGNTRLVLGEHRRARRNGHHQCRRIF